MNLLLLLLFYCCYCYCYYTCIAEWLAISNFELNICTIIIKSYYYLEIILELLQFHDWPVVCLLSTVKFEFSGVKVQRSWLLCWYADKNNCFKHLCVDMQTKIPVLNILFIFLYHYIHVAFQINSFYTLQIYCTYVWLLISFAHHRGQIKMKLWPKICWMLLFYRISTVLIEPCIDILTL